MSEESSSLKKKCKHFIIDLEEQSELSMSELMPICESKIPNEAKHGDIVYTQKFFRSLDVFFVQVLFNEHKKCYEKHLCQNDINGSGLCSVPFEVTRAITDPISFYDGAFKFDDYDENDFLGIEIESETHQDLIKKYVGKTLSKPYKCIYFHRPCDYGDVGLYLWFEDKNDRVTGSKFVKLTPDFDESSLVH